MNTTTEIFTPAQRMTIKTKGADWLKGKLGNASLKDIIEPFSFDLVTDDTCWLRSGAISICMTETKTNYRGETFEIKIPVNETRNGICTKIGNELCRMLREHLKWKTGSNDSFNSVFKYKHHAFITKAKEWLDEDILADADWISCFKIKAFEGRKIIATTYKGSFTLEIDLLFNADGCVEIDDLTSKIVQWFEASVGSQGILDDAKQNKIRPFVSAATAKAIHATGYAYPYLEDIKTKTLKIKKEIKMAAQILGIPPLAVAGAFADLLEVDTTYNTKKFHDMCGEIVWRGAGKIAKEWDEGIGAFLDYASSTVGGGHPMAGRILAGLDLVWAAAPSRYKTDAAEYLSKQAFTIVSWLNRRCDIAATRNRDDFVGEQARLDIQELAKSAKTLPEKIKKLKSDLQVVAMEKMPIETFLAFRMYFHIAEDERLLNKAMQIAPKLGNIGQAAEQRNRIHKWERFYRYF